MVSREAKEIMEMLAKGKNPNQGESDAAEVQRVRKMLADGGEENAKFLPDCVSVKKVSDEPVSGEWISYNGEGKDTEKVLYFLYGGGFETGSVASRRNVCAGLAAALHMDAFAVSYRQWPEAVHPAALTDCVEGFHWLVKQGYQPGNIRMFGESAGATLVITSVLYMKDHGGELPERVSVFSPVINIAGDYPSRRERDARDPMIGAESKPAYFTEKDEKDPYASAMYADFKGFPAMQINGGTEEVLFDDALHLYELAKAAKVTVTRKAWEGMFHSFILFPCPETTQAVEEIAAFLSK